MVGLTGMLTRLWRRPPVPATLPVVDEPRELLTVSDVAERCFVSRQAVYNWIDEGRLRPIARYRHGDQWALLFSPDDVIGLRRRRPGPKIGA